MVGNPAVFEEPPSTRPPDESFPSSVFCGSRTWQKTADGLYFRLQVSPPGMLEARRYCVDSSQHSSPIGKALYRLHLNFRLEAPGGRLPISATHRDMKLH
jgi:hypothetical protein